jgi:hypothetical protein
MKHRYLQALQDRAFDACAKAALQGNEATQATHAIIDWIDALTEEQLAQAEVLLRRQRRQRCLLREVGL